MKFAKLFAGKRYEQIVIMKKQTAEGAPEIRFYFTVEGFGVCEFAIGFADDDADESRFEQAFREMTPQIATEIIDGYMAHMTASAKEHH